MGVTSLWASPEGERRVDVSSGSAPRNLGLSGYLAPFGFPRIPDSREVKRLGTPSRCSPLGEARNLETPTHFPQRIRWGTQKARDTCSRPKFEGETVRGTHTFFTPPGEAKGSRHPCAFHIGSPGEPKPFDTPTQPQIPGARRLETPNRVFHSFREAKTLKTTHACSIWDPFGNPELGLAALRNCRRKRSCPRGHSSQVPGMNRGRSPELHVGASCCSAPQLAGGGWKCERPAPGSRRRPSALQCAFSAPALREPRRTLDCKGKKRKIVPLRRSLFRETLCLPEIRIRPNIPQLDANSNAWRGWWDFRSSGVAIVCIRSRRRRKRICSSQGHTGTMNLDSLRLLFPSLVSAHGGWGSADGHGSQRCICYATTGSRVAPGFARSHAHDSRGLRSSDAEARPAIAVHCLFGALLAWERTVVSVLRRAAGKKAMLV